MDVSVVFDDLKGWLHFVTPIEPILEGPVGPCNEQYLDFYNQENQIAFRVSNGKYTFSGDPNYFQYESGEVFTTFPGQEAEIHEDYRLRRSSYEWCRRFFLRHGRIPYSAEPEICDPETSPSGPLITQLGGDPVMINWTGIGPPKNQRGTLFRYIGEVQGYSYCARGIQAILMFFDPEEQIALFRFEWT